MESRRHHLAESLTGAVHLQKQVEDSCLKRAQRKVSRSFASFHQGRFKSLLHATLAWHARAPCERSRSQVFPTDSPAFAPQVPFGNSMDFRSRCATDATAWASQRKSAPKSRKLRTESERSLPALSGRFLWRFFELAAEHPATRIPPF